MFKSARIKLALWYLIIIMLVSTSFSFAIYRVLTSELDRVERIQRTRIEHRQSDRNFSITQETRNDLSSFMLDPDIIEETKKRLATILIAINLGILGSSAGAGYFLAGRTLKPIKDMVDEQNRFITDASHELRTPITSLKSEIEVNLRDKKMDIIQAKKLLESNLEEVNNLQVLSDDLIKLTQYGKGQNNLAISEVSLNLIINEAMKKTAGFSRSNKIEIINKSKDYQIEASRPALIELFVIFLDNAIKYSPKNTKVVILSEKTDDHINVSIKDQGYGISDENIQHIFDRFYRVDKSRTKSDVPGYGLGLSIAKEIIDKLHGSISIQSKLSKGTTFTVKLPFKYSHKLI